ncbi:leucyl aminopeptidase family protein [Angustibacter aerolatus]
MRAPRIRALAARLPDVVREASPRIDVLALPVQPADGDTPPRPVGDAPAVARQLGIDLDRVLALERVKGTAGEVVRVPWTPGTGHPAVDRVVLVGTGDGSPAAVRSGAAALARAHRGLDRLVTTLGAEGGEHARAAAEGFVLATYTPPRSGVGEGPRPPLRRVEVVGRRASLTAYLARGVTVAAEPVLARDLANTPSSTKGPAWVAGRARRAAAEVGLSCRVLDSKALAAEGFGGILAVGAAAARSPRLVELGHVPPGATDRTPHVVLVGKGITFDSGGLSLKPRDAMIPIKTDMTGAAVVLAVLRAAARLGVRVRVTGLLPLAENAIGASSYRPGDVVTQYGGSTVEIANTDAEGRIVLADALAYADAVLDPDVVVDVATLTGAATQGLGRGHGALFSGDDRLATALLDAGRLSGEQLWRMPLVEDYRWALDSQVADVGHVAPAKTVGAGAVVAALFLREFVGGRRWAHLDIAGPARSERDAGVITRGGTGFGARLLLRWLETLR